MNKPNGTFVVYNDMPLFFEMLMILILKLVLKQRNR